MNRTIGWSAVFAAVIAAVGGSSTSPALADDEAVAQCISASDQALDLRKQGQLLQARKRLAVCASPACGADISDTCQKRIAEINELLPTIVFVPKNGAGDDVAGVKLYVDGAPYADKLDGSAVMIDPGEHEFRFEVSAQEPVSKRFVLRQGEKNRREEILIGPPAPLAPPVPPPAQPAAAPPSAPTVVLLDSRATPEPQQLDSTGSFQRTMGTLLLAVGIPVAALTGLYYGGAALTKWTAAQSDCNTACGEGSQAQTERHDAGSAATSANIAFAAAGVALVGGIVLRVTAPARRPIASPPREVRVLPAVSNRGGEVLLSGTFP